MSELTHARLRELLGKEGNKRAQAERALRDMTAENARLKTRIAELESRP